MISKTDYSTTSKIGLVPSASDSAAKRHVPPLGASSAFFPRVQLTTQTILTCVMFLGTMVVLRMDMLMCLFITLAIATFYRMYSGEGARKSDPVMLPVWIFLALFTKGTGGSAMPPLAIAVFLAVKRDWKGFRKYLDSKPGASSPGLRPFGSAVSGSRADPEYINNLLVKQTVGRAVNAFTHAKPFWFYLVAIIWWCLAPYCLLLIGSLVVSLIPARHLPWTKPPEPRDSSHTPSSKRSDIGDFAPLRDSLDFSIVMLSCFSSKLPIYLVPVFPFHRLSASRPAWQNRRAPLDAWAVESFNVLFIIVGAGALLILLGAVSVPAVNELLNEYSFAREIPVINGIILLTIANCIGLWFLVKRKCWNIPSFLLGAGLLLAVFSASAIIRDVNPYIGYGSICAKVPEGTQVATVFLHRPKNIDTYIGRQITDYGKDCDKLAEDIGEASASGSEARHLTIVTRRSRLESEPLLQEDLQVRHRRNSLRTLLPRDGDHPINP